MKCLFLYAAFFYFGDILQSYVNQNGVMSTIMQFMSTSLVDITQKQAYKIRIFMILSARGGKIIAEKGIMKGGWPQTEPRRRQDGGKMNQPRPTSSNS